MGAERKVEMLDLHPQFVVNTRGKEIAVLLPLHEYERLIEELEIRQDIRAAEDAKAKGETPIPLADALAQIDGHVSKRR